MGAGGGVGDGELAAKKHTNRYSIQFNNKNEEEKKQRTRRRTMVLRG